MVQPESKPCATEFEPLRPALIEPIGAALPGTNNAQKDEIEDDVALRGVVAIDVPREVIARFSGTLNLNELPERQPEIVIQRGPLSREDDDE